MKKLLLLSALLIFGFSFGQTSSHIVFGIDLNKDWYTLTEQSATAYFIQEDFKKKNNQPGVSVDISEEYLNSNGDKEFLGIGTFEIVLVFEQGQQSNLKDALPSSMLINLSKYGKSEKSAKMKAFSKLSSLLMNQFGAPSSTMKKDWGSNFQWNLTNAQIMLNLQYEEIKIFYSKK